MLSVHKERSEGTGQRTYQPDTDQHQHHSDKSAVEGTWGDIAVADCSCGDESPPDAVTEVHAFSVMYQHAARDDGHESGEDHVFEAVCIVETLCFSQRA